MKSLQQYISEKLIVNKNYNPSSSERPFDEIISAIEELRRDGKYHVIDPKNHFNIDAPKDSVNKRKVNDTFKKMEMCILYNSKICDRRLYTETFNKCEHIINHNSDDFYNIWTNWDEWTDNGYKRNFTIVEDSDDIIIMIVNDRVNIDDTYILVGM